MDNGSIISKIKYIDDSGNNVVNAEVGTNKVTEIGFIGEMGIVVICSEGQEPTTVPIGQLISEL